MSAITVSLPYTYNIQNLPLPNVKDLGVMFDVKLKFNVHISKS